MQAGMSGRCACAAVTAGTCVLVLLALLTCTAVQGQGKEDTEEAPTQISINSAKSHPN